MRLLPPRILNVHRALRRTADRFTCLLAFLLILKWMGWFSDILKWQCFRPLCSFRLCDVTYSWQDETASQPIDKNRHWAPWETRISSVFVFPRNGIQTQFHVSTTNDVCINHTVITAPGLSLNAVLNYRLWIWVSYTGFIAANKQTRSLLCSLPAEIWTSKCQEGRMRQHKSIPLEEHMKRHTSDRHSAVTFDVSVKHNLITENVVTTLRQCFSTFCTNTVAWRSRFSFMLMFVCTCITVFIIIHSLCLYAL
jgi:hypothetical protein